MPPLTKEDFRRLTRLQEQDKVLDALQAEIDKVPVEIAAIRKELEGEKAALNEAKARSTSLQLKKKEDELELSHKEDAARKHGAELNVVKTNEAFKALRSEIDKAKAAAGDLETAILMLMEEIDRAARDEKRLAAELKAKESEGSARIQALEARKAGLESKAAAETAKRAGLAEGLPAEMTRVYDHTRKRRRGTAASPIVNGACGACRVTVPPQVVVEATKGHSLLTCESCQRILYMPEPAGAAATADKPA